MSKNLINALQIDHNSVKFITAQEIEIANQGSIIQVLGMSEKVGHWDTEGEIDKDLLASYIKSSHIENERIAGQKITSTLVSVNSGITSRYITHELFFNNIVITEEHIKSFYESKDFTQLYENQDIPIHTLPISYKIDEKKIVSDPIGHKAQMLTVKWHVISISKNQLKDIHDLLDASDLQMKQCVLASYASSLAAINEMESSLGVICLDINYYKTEVTIIIDDQLVFFDSSDVGLKYVNNDLQSILNVSDEDSDKLRIKWSNDNSSKNLDESEIRIKQIISSRLEEIIELALKKLKISKYYDLANSHIVLTGEGAKHADIIDLATNIFKTKNIRIGSPQKIHGLKTIIENPSNSTCLGMLNYALSTEFQFNAKDESDKKKSVLSMLYNFFKAI
ncbi:MAG: cell division FtsA domain-containing protein [Candidatus Pelagibacterales bacterium]